MSFKNRYRQSPPNEMDHPLSSPASADSEDEGDSLEKSVWGHHPENPRFHTLPNSSKPQRQASRDTTRETLRDPPRELSREPPRDPQPRDPPRDHIARDPPRDHRSTRRDTQETPRERPLVRLVSHPREYEKDPDSDSLSDEPENNPAPIPRPRPAPRLQNHSQKRVPATVTIETETPNVQLFNAQMQDIQRKRKQIPRSASASLLSSKGRVSRQGSRPVQTTQNKPLPRPRPPSKPPVETSAPLAPVPPSLAPVPVITLSHGITWFQSSCLTGKQVYQTITDGKQWHLKGNPWQNRLFRLSNSATKINLQSLPPDVHYPLMMSLHCRLRGRMTISYFPLAVQGPTGMQVPSAKICGITTFDFLCFLETIQKEDRKVSGVMTCKIVNCTKVLARTPKQCLAVQDDVFFQVQLFPNVTKASNKQVMTSPQHNEIVAQWYYLDFQVGHILAASKSSPLSWMAELEYSVVE